MADPPHYGFDGVESFDDEELRYLNIRLSESDQHELSHEEQPPDIAMDLFAKFVSVYKSGSQELKWKVYQKGGCVMTYKKDLSEWKMWAPADTSKSDVLDFDGWTMYVALDVKKEVGCNFHAFYFEKDSSFLCVRRFDVKGNEDRFRLKLACLEAGSPALLHCSNITEAIQKYNDAKHYIDSAPSSVSPDQAPLQLEPCSTVAAAVALVPGWEPGASAAAGGGRTGGELISKRRRVGSATDTAALQRPDGAGGDGSSELRVAIDNIVRWMLSREEAITFQDLQNSDHVVPLRKLAIKLEAALNNSRLDELTQLIDDETNEETNQADNVTIYFKTGPGLDDLHCNAAQMRLLQAVTRDPRGLKEILADLPKKVRSNYHEHDQACLAHFRRNGPHIVQEYITAHSEKFECLTVKIAYAQDGAVIGLLGISLYKQAEVKQAKRILQAYCAGYEQCRIDLGRN